MRLMGIFQDTLSKQVPFSSPQNNILTRDVDTLVTVSCCAGVTRAYSSSCHHCHAPHLVLQQKPQWLEIFQQRLDSGFLLEDDDGGGGDNWCYKTCKAPVKLPLPTNTRLYTGWMPFLSPNQQCQST